MLVQFKKCVYHPIYLREMKEYANEVCKYRNTLVKYYNLLEPGKEKTEVYDRVIGIDNIVAEVRNEIQNYESDWNDSKFIIFSKNTKEHRRLECVETSIINRCNQIKEMYERVKEKVK